MAILITDKYLHTDLLPVLFKPLNIFPFLERPCGAQLSHDPLGLKNWERNKQKQSESKAKVKNSYI